MLLDFSAACCNFFFLNDFDCQVCCIRETQAWTLPIWASQCCSVLYSCAWTQKLPLPVCALPLALPSLSSLSLWFIFAAPPHNSSYRSLHLLWNGKTEPILRILGIFFFSYCGRLAIIMRGFVADLKLKVIGCGIQGFKQLRAVDCEGRCNN